MLSYLSCSVKRARPSGLTFMVTTTHSVSVTEAASGGVSAMRTLHKHKNCKRLISTVRPAETLIRRKIVGQT